MVREAEPWTSGCWAAGHAEPEALASWNHNWMLAPGAAEGSVWPLPRSLRAGPLVAEEVHCPSLSPDAGWPPARPWPWPPTKAGVGGTQLSPLQPGWGLQSPRCPGKACLGGREDFPTATQAPAPMPPACCPDDRPEDRGDDRKLGCPPPNPVGQTPRDSLTLADTGAVHPHLRAAPAAATAANAPWPSGRLCPNKDVYSFKHQIKSLTPPAPSLLSRHSSI